MKKTKPKKRRTSFAFRESVPFLTSLFVSLGQHARKRGKRKKKKTFSSVGPPLLFLLLEKKGRSCVLSHVKEKKKRGRSHGVRTDADRAMSGEKRRWRSMPMRNKMKNKKERKNSSRSRSSLPPMCRYI